MNPILRQFKEKPHLLFFGMAAVLLVVSILWMPTSRNSSQTDMASHGQRPQHKREIDSINRHLQDAQKKLELSTMNAEIDNQVFARKFEELGVGPLNQYQPGTQGIDLRQEDQMQRLYEDIYGDRNSGSQDMTPEELVSSRLALRQWLNEYNQVRRREYVEAFLDAARADGYEVFLNDQLEVVEVRKLMGERHRPYRPGD